MVTGHVGRADALRPRGGAVSVLGVCVACTEGRAQCPLARVLVGARIVSGAPCCFLFSC